MPERFERLLRIACLCLGALLLFQLARLATRKDPLANLSIPALPSFSPTTNAPATSNQPLAPAGTNSGRTNLLLAPSLPNPATHPAGGPGRPQTATNVILSPGPGPQGPPAAAMAMMGMNPMGPGGPGPKGPPLPPATQARIDRIIDSELLAPVIRPLPMALLGIAGQDVFLRAPNGQTGLVKEGGEVGGVKLLRIGINRVLVEAEGKQKELTIFSGLGGESLLPKEKETPQ